MQLLPITTNRNEIDIQILQGNAVFNFHRQIEKILQHAPNGKNISLFYSEAAVNNTRNEITWFTKATGKIRTMQELQPEERSWVSEQLKVFSAAIKLTIKELETTAGEKSFGVEALKNIFIAPDIQNSLFLVGSALVIAEWGCVPSGADPRDYDLLLLDLPYNIIPTNSITETESVTQPPRFLWRSFAVVALIFMLIINLASKTYSPMSVNAALNTNAEKQLKLDIQNLKHQTQEKLDSCQIGKEKAVNKEFTISRPTENKVLDQKALERKDLSVFNGDWRMITELYEADNAGKAQLDKKVEYKLNFYNDGKGVFSLQYNDGDICKTPISVHIESKDKFIINAPKLECQKRNPRDISIDKSGNIICNLTKPDHASCQIQCYKGPCDTSFEK